MCIRDSYYYYYYYYFYYFYYSTASVGLQMRQFWGQQQRFFKEMANASKVEFVVAQAKEALESGMSVVVGLQSTGESGMDKVG